MDSELTDLAGVKGVTISTLQVKPSEGAFVNGDKTKLDTIETNADVTDATNVQAAGAVMTTGNETIDGDKTFSSTISGSIDGNAVTATKLENTRNINGVAFNGTQDITITAAGDTNQTSIESILNTNLAVGRDTGNQIKFGVDNEIHFRVKDQDKFKFTDSALIPLATNSYDLGSSSNKWKDLHISSDSIFMGTGDKATKISVDSSGNLDFVKESDPTTKRKIKADTTGNAATATALETARTIHGVSFDGTENIDLSEVVQDTVGAMFTSNTETGITATYQDGDGTIDLVVGTLNQNTTGNADTATLSSKVTVSDNNDDTYYPLVFHDENNSLLDDTGSLTYNPKNGLKLSDNKKIYLGDSGDLEIYHDGSNSYIEDTGTGTIKYRSGTQTFQNAAGSKTMAVFNAANSVDLHYDNSKKFETTNTGVSITGAITATDDITAFSSDKRLKTNIEIIESPLDKINKLSGFTYNWDKDKCEKAGFIPKDEEQIGVFAQDVQSVIPQAVKPAPFDTDEHGKSKSGENYLTVQYEKIVPLLIECIKEQQNQIDELKDEIILLKKMNNNI